MSRNGKSLCTNNFRRTGVLDAPRAARLYSTLKRRHMIDAFLTLGLAALASVPAIFRQAPVRKPSASDVRTRDVYVTVVGTTRICPSPASPPPTSPCAKTAPRARCSGPSPATRPDAGRSARRRQPGLSPALQPLREGLTTFVDKAQGPRRDRHRHGRRARHVARAVHDRHQRAEKGHQPDLRAARLGRLPARRHH